MLRPDYAGGGLANLIASIVEACGGAPRHPGLTLLPARDLCEARNILLLLIDGLGDNYLQREGAGGALLARRRGAITSVFPSTTASAVTTTYTGWTPLEHGLTGWWTLFGEAGCVGAPLPFQRRGEKAALSAAPQRVYRAGSLFDGLARRSIVVSPFRVAILADIHGNRDAPDAILTDVHRQSPDQIIFAGDLVMNGPHPHETLTRVAGLGIPGVLGNTDDEVIRGGDPAAAWTQHLIGQDGVAYLQTLVPDYRVTPPGAKSSQHDLIIVHSTPRSCYDLLILEPHPLVIHFTEPTPYSDAVRMLAGTRADLIIYGHFHYVSKGVIDGQRIISIGSVGFPFDGDRRAAYSIAHWDGARW